MPVIKHLLLLLPFLFAFLPSPGQSGSPMPTREQSRNVPNDTTLLVGTVPVDFLFPGPSVRGAILVLPGWNFGRRDVCAKSGFCRKAEMEGFALVLPEMLKSVYSSGFFKETRGDWKRYPSLQWIIDTLIPYCRDHFQLFRSGDANFLYGISTGGRGVARVAENTGNLFLAGAALSGDFDQTAMPDDKLMTGYYGPYKDFRERWEGADNPSRNSDRLTIPLYLAHGKKDAIVPCAQTIAFYEKILSEHPEKGHLLYLCDTCGHNYSFWDSCTDNVLRFFLRTGKSLRHE